MGKKCGCLHAPQRGSASPAPSTQRQASPAPILPRTTSRPPPRAAPSQPPRSRPRCPRAPSLSPVIHPGPCHSLREGTSSSKLPHSPNSSPLTPPREPVGRAGLKITRRAASESGGQRARPGPPAPTCFAAPALLASVGHGLAWPWASHGTPPKKVGAGVRRAAAPAHLYVGCRHRLCHWWPWGSP